MALYIPPSISCFLERCRASGRVLTVMEDSKPSFTFQKTGVCGKSWGISLAQRYFSSCIPEISEYLNHPLWGGKKLMTVGRLEIIAEGTDLFYGHSHKYLLTGWLARCDEVNSKTPLNGKVILEEEEVLTVGEERYQPFQTECLKWSWSCFLPFPFPWTVGSQNHHSTGKAYDGGESWRFRCYLLPATHN